MEWQHDEVKPMGLVEGKYFGLGVKVMTDEQMEMLRKQISVYATICERLVEMHKSISAQQDFAGTGLGNRYCDPLLSAAFHKIPSRQRWNPKAAQLQILEHIFQQCNATPGRQKIKEITNELAQHGQISESNVYNWFQNRRARSKRKQPALLSDNEESEKETEPESAKEKMTKPEDIQPDESLVLLSNHMYCRSPEMGTETSHLVPQPNIGIDQLVGKLEVLGSENPYWQEEQYDLFG